MTDRQSDPTSVDVRPRIPRLNGDGVYEIGDRVLALDVAHNEVRAGVVSGIWRDKKSDYLVVTYGDEPFLDNFLAQRDDLRDDLPDPEDVEELIAWLERGA